MTLFEARERLARYLQIRAGIYDFKFTVQANGLLLFDVYTLTVSLIRNYDTP